jgi:hypothetical protein
MPLRALPTTQTITDILSLHGCTFHLAFLDFLGASAAVENVLTKTALVGRFALPQSQRRVSGLHFSIVNVDDSPPQSGNSCRRQQLMHFPASHVGVE